MKRSKASAKAKAWKDANPWFGKNIEATTLALHFHEVLLKHGIKVDTDEYYEQLDTRLRLAGELGLMKEVK